MLKVVFIKESSLSTAIKVYPNSLRRTILHISFADKGLSLDPYSFSPLLDLYYLLERSKLKNKTDSTPWHDTNINTITQNRLNYNETDTVWNLTKTLCKHTWTIMALICCQRERSIDVYDQLRLLKTLINTTGKKLLSSSKQKQWCYRRNRRMFYPSVNLEAKFLQFFLKRLDNLRPIVTDLNKSVSSVNTHMDDFIFWMTHGWNKS